MGKSIIAICFLLCIILPNVFAASKIKHIIVLMEENRSFDHMFGYYPGVNGLTGKEFNLLDPADPKSTSIMVNKNQPQIALCDPDHGTPGTTIKIFGAAAAKNDFTNATMTGFVERESKNAKTNYCNVMEMMNPETVPVITALAQNFGLMDHFFCDHPGPTWPNRLFMLTATSAGDTSTGAYYHNKAGALYPQATFYDQLNKEGLQWKHYYNDTPWELFIESVANNMKHVVPMAQFYADAKAGTLPSFAFINPRLSANTTTKEASNDQHPDHDVSLGEKYYKDIYEALRASPQWNETLYIITYDEHGGFYDHVPTPLNVPPPGDGEASYPDTGFLFDRLGVRIPALLISPWIPKGLVISEPPAAQKPAPNSQYALTSIMATARKLLGMTSPPLTKRDAWAATFEHVFTLDTPRTDCPLHLPEAAKPSPFFSIEAEADLPVNGLQEYVMKILASLAGVDYPHHITRQGDIGAWTQEHLRIHAQRTGQQLHV
jgi:phospholipase C